MGIVKKCRSCGEDVRPYDLAEHPLCDSCAERVTEYVRGLLEEYEHAAKNGAIVVGLAKVGAELNRVLIMLDGPTTPKPFVVAAFEYRDCAPLRPDVGEGAIKSATEGDDE